MQECDLKTWKVVDKVPQWGGQWKMLFEIFEAEGLAVLRPWLMVKNFIFHKCEFWWIWVICDVGFAYLWIFDVGFCRCWQVLSRMWSWWVIFRFVGLVAVFICVYVYACVWLNVLISGFLFRRISIYWTSDFLFTFEFPFFLERISFSLSCFNVISLF